MYLEYYGFSELPFELTPNPKFLFLAAPYTEALSNLRYGIQARKPLTLLTGDPGTGKTTLITSALSTMNSEGAVFCQINNPTLSRSEFVELIADGFSLSPEAKRSKATMLLELVAVLTRRSREGRLSALVVDEAQSLSDELLEEIRLLANIETDSEKLLPIILAGQPELSTRLEQDRLRQIKQRVALRCALRALDLHETAAYMSKRIRTAGGDNAKIFTREAVTAIHEHSCGIPRLISVLSDNALVTGFALDRRPVTRDLVLEVAKDFCLRPTNSVGVEIATASEASPPTQHVASDELPATAAAAPGRRFRYFF